MKTIIKSIFQGSVKGMPIWMILILVGMTMNTFSTHGVNGVTPTVPQSHSASLAVVGAIIAIFGIPGLCWFVISLIISPFSKHQ